MVNLLHALLILILLLAISISFGFSVKTNNLSVSDAILQNCLAVNEFDNVTSYTQGSFLMAVGIFDVIAFVIFLKFLNENLEEKHTETQRNRMKRVFSIVLGCAITQILYSLTSSVRKSLITSVFVRALTANILSVLWQFPCVLAICYFHHVNYKTQSDDSSLKTK